MSRAKRLALQAVLIGLGAALVVAGILTGEPGVILRRSILICLECIGIG
jgi:ABC-type protease/lipase transport system fused ATPase/permease subunit